MIKIDTNERDVSKLLDSLDSQLTLGETIELLKELSFTEINAPFNFKFERCGIDPYSNFEHLTLRIDGEHYPDEPVTIQDFLSSLEALIGTSVTDLTEGCLEVTRDTLLGLEYNDNALSRKTLAAFLTHLSST